MQRSPIAAIAAAVVVSSSSHAGLVTTSSQAAFNAIVASRALQTAAFGFDGVAGPTPSLSGGSAWNAWEATAPGGVWRSGTGLLQTTFTDIPLTFTFAPNSVYAVGGTFFVSNSNYQVIPGSLIKVTLASGQSYVSASGASNFAGFISTSAIASITIKPQVENLSVDQFATVGGLMVAGVPAPGAVALLGVAGLIATRRRR
jgi:MYXO-CTERM domain-containing protein